MSAAVKASDVEGKVRTAANGRPYVILKGGKSRMLSKEDATRLKRELGSSTKKTKTKTKAKTSSGAEKKTKKTKKYLGDLL